MIGLFGFYRTGAVITFYQCRGGKIVKVVVVMLAGHNEDLTE